MALDALDLGEHLLGRSGDQVLDLVGRGASVCRECGSRLRARVTCL